MNDMFKQIIAKKGVHAIKELAEIFAGLEPVAIDELTGEWRVGYLFTEGTGNTWETLIKCSPFKLYSKMFFDRNHVKAWVFRYFGIKFSLPMTSALLRRMDFRGKNSTAMIYNYLPLIDNFRKVDENTVMGIMEVIGKVSVYFYLLRLPTR